MSALDPQSVARWSTAGGALRSADAVRELVTPVATDTAGASRAVALLGVELRSSARASGRLLTVVARWRPSASAPWREEATTLRIGEVASRWSSASRDLRAAAVGARFAELLAAGEHGAMPGGDLDELSRRAAGLDGTRRGDAAHDLARLVARAREVAARSAAHD